jgi:uncharacterized secreted protein with C-terminal beta-propeller domain
MTTSRRLAFRVLGPALALALPWTSGCDGGGLGYEPEHPVDASRAFLHRAETCDDLLTSVREDAYAKVEIQAQRYLEWYARDDAGGSGTADAGAAAPEDASRSADDASPDEYSETNTQVEGVDEADIVETDGERIYLVSENELVVVDSWPADETHVLARFTLEGFPYEMFVHEGRAVVFSQTADPRRPPEESHCGDHYARWGYYYPCYSGGTQFTKITVVDLGPEAASPSVVREVFVQGHYRSARRHDTQVRAVIRNWGFYFDWQLPQVWEYLHPDGSYVELTPAQARERIYAWRADALAAIDEKPLEDWLPAMLERDGGALRDVPVDCGRFYVTRPGIAEYGMTQIAGLDLADGDAAPTRTGIWGSAQELYANHETLLLAQADYSAYYRAYLEEADEISVSTILHRFALTDGGGTAYEASGVVPGTLVDQFSLDERDGIVRVATTENRWIPWWTREGGEWVEPPPSRNRVFTLERDGRALSILGQTEVLAEGERIFSARFMGDELAYVVTFRQVDPLFAIDLSDPAHPVVLGELKIPGFSNYMHPLGEGHLLTIGREATEDGRVQGLALQIFDVRDPTAPTLAHKHVFTDRWGYSVANWDHKAFTYFGARQLLAFPYVAHGEDWRSFRSSLEVFHVDAEDGFREVGSIDHTSLLEGECAEGNHHCYDHGMRIRRGVFIEDYVYSISYGGIRVDDTRDMSAVTAVEL